MGRKRKDGDEGVHAVPDGTRGRGCSWWGPAGILEGMTQMSRSVWVWIILAYYLLAALLPIDKIIGKVYPVFGFALLFMAMGMLYVLFSGDYSIPELTGATLANMKAGTG